MGNFRLGIEHLPLAPPAHPLYGTTRAPESPHDTGHDHKPMTDQQSTPFLNAQFSPGQLVQHRLFDYRGVIVDVDPDFQNSDDWYQSMARSKPPKDKPWYHVLVHGADHMTYVAERNLEADESAKPVKHPALDHFFETFENGRYLFHRRTN